MIVMQSKFIHDQLIPAILLVIFVGCLAAIQFSTPDLPDNDGFYHIKYAQLMRSEGLVPEFRWLPYTILNQDEFYDHHFLYHVFLIPFTFGDLRLGAKWAAVILPAIAFLSIYFLFNRQRVPAAWLWALGVVTVSEAFLYRMSITRTQSLSLFLLILGMLWLLEEKHWHLAGLAFVFVWSYNAFPLLLVMGVLYFVAALIIKRETRWRGLAYICAGILAGLIINPFFPRNLVFTFRHILPKLGTPAISGLGNEWFPYTTAQLLENSFAALLAFISGAFALGLKGRKMNIKTAFAFLLTLFFAILLFRARRFVEYFPPFALIFAAFAWAPLTKKLLADQTNRNSSRNQTWKAWKYMVLAVILIALSGYQAISSARLLIRSSKPYHLYREAAAWLEENTPENTLVFQTDWDDFPRLFFYNTHNTYLAGLDPTYLQQYDPALFDLWVDITRGRVENPSEKILEDFNARIILSDLNHDDFINQAEADPQIIEVYRDKQAVIFQIPEKP